MSGTKGTPMFEHGIIFQGVSNNPSFLRGPSAALDMMMPTLDRLFGLQD
jgi:indoleamine 2,3-dioxygenase